MRTLSRTTPRLRGQSRSARASVDGSGQRRRAVVNPDEAAVVWFEVARGGGEFFFRQEVDRHRLLTEPRRFQLTNDPSLQP